MVLFEVLVVMLVIALIVVIGLLVVVMVWGTKNSVPANEDVGTLESPVGMLYRCSQFSCGSGYSCDSIYQVCKKDNGERCDNASDCLNGSFCSGLCVTGMAGVESGLPFDPCPCGPSMTCGEWGMSSEDATTAAYVIMMSPVIPCGMSEEEMKDYALRYLSFYRVVVFWKPCKELYESEISLWRATLNPLSNTLEHSGSFLVSLLDRRLHFLNRTDTSNTHRQALTDGYWLSLVFKYMMRGYESTLELGYNGALNLALNLPLNLLVDASS